MRDGESLRRCRWLREIETCNASRFAHRIATEYLYVSDMESKNSHYGNIIYTARTRNVGQRSGSVQGSPLPRLAGVSSFLVSRILSVTIIDRATTCFAWESGVLVGVLMTTLLGWVGTMASWPTQKKCRSSHLCSDFHAELALVLWRHLSWRANMVQFTSTIQYTMYYWFLALQ